MSSFLFLRDHSLEEWKQLAQTTHKAQYERLLKQAASYADHLPPADHPRDSITYIGMACANMALANLLTDDESYLNTMRKWLKVGIGYPHWGLARMPDHDLDAAWLLFGFSLALNWVGDRLPADERSDLIAKLRLQGERLYEFSITDIGTSWTRHYWQNHNWICNGGFLTAAYALAADDYDTSHWIEDAIVDFKRVVWAFPEDGSDYEGPVYWRYGFQFLLFPLHMLKQESSVDLHDSDFLRNAFNYRIAVAAANWVNTANFGDCHDRASSHSRMMLYRMASVYRNGHAQWLANHFDEIGEWDREGREGMVKPGLLPEAWVDFVWYDPSVEPEPLETLPTTMVFPDLGLITTRSSWKKDATYLAFKCGTPNGNRGWQLGQMFNRMHDWKTIKADHDHNDANSFILTRGDDYLTVDQGYSKAKWTRHHSTLLVDGRGQYLDGDKDPYKGLTEEWGAKLEDWFVADGAVYMHGEAAGAYPAELDLTRYSRQMLMLGPETIIICDDIELDSPQKLEWLMQTDSAAYQVSRQTWRVEADTNSLQVDVFEPHHTVMISEQRIEEISANPTSAKPDWIITRDQHQLVLSPDQPTTKTRYFIVLSLSDDGGLGQLDCQFGSAAQVNGSLIAFASGRCHMRIADRLTTDAAWCAINENFKVAGNVTSLWHDGRLIMIASSPADIALSASGCKTSAKRPTWISLHVAQEPTAVQINGEDTASKYDAELELLRFEIPAGESAISFKY
ncbi:MAG: heparinase II/III family protein [Chloroflexota bacterium]